MKFKLTFLALLASTSLFANYYGYGQYGYSSCPGGNCPYQGQANYPGTTGQMYYNTPGYNYQGGYNYSQPYYNTNPMYQGQITQDGYYGNMRGPDSMGGYTIGQ